MSKDIRDAFFDRICEYAIKDPNVVIITDDMDVFSLHQFRSEHPDRFLNPGVAEQQVINLAAGLAHAGKKVIVCGIASFITLRCFEQIKVNICSMNLPVVVVGLGVGLGFAMDGPTHHGVNDVAIMRTLPEIDIFNPIDETSAMTVAEITYQSKKPCYVRIDKGVMPDIYDNRETLENVGYTQILPESDINIISTGYATHLVNGIVSGYGLFDVYRLKPINESLLLKLSRASKGIVTVEEHMSGGLFSIVVAWMSRNNIFIPVKEISLKDGQYLQYGSREWLCSKNGLSPDRILKEIQDFDMSVKRYKDD